LPYAIALADKGWKKACKEDEALKKGLNVVDGKVTFKAVADLYKKPFVDSRDIVIIQ
jgi:alanine dehydrogenase